MKSHTKFGDDMLHSFRVIEIVIRCDIDSNDIAGFKEHTHVLYMIPSCFISLLQRSEADSMILEEFIRRKKHVKEICTKFSAYESK